MADETTTQPGQEPAASTPPGQAPTSPALSHADALEALAAARREAAAHRTKLTTLEKAQADAETAKLSEQEKLVKRLAALEAESAERSKAHQATVTRYEVQLAASRLGIVDTDAAVTLLLAGTTLEYADDGTPSNLDKALKDLLKARPWLAGATSGATGNPTNPARNGGAGAPLTKADIERMSPQEINQRWPEIQAALAQLR